jgi:hypothetical protein
MLFFETDLHLQERDPPGSFQTHSGVEETSVYQLTPAPKMNSTVPAALQRTRGKIFHTFFFIIIG